MKVKLLSSDGVLFEVDESTASRSGVIRTVLVDVGNKDPIPLLNVKSHVLTKVLEYCEHHRNEPLPPLDVEYSISPSLDIMRRKNTHISGWDQQYMKCEQELLFEVIQAASYLDIQSLLDLGCRTVANMMTGKSVDDIRQLFHIENDFTPEEEVC
ncbi:S-phase kinase-associated protein 1A-like protein [Cantharellus anzutake]|uniref:S-phase kinase-associated protein 1A-like protein n=1 Tax=Cantharellus anzutake TaxID=1750568 RepID=UPI001905D31E|nr:S-phase kinase-associated protein 1A-like protein [Cantharellus anzutake]KAF8329485.1 S-phase kinase-associated protein 1A-like protein [Cantharellus anzutake]